MDGNYKGRGTVLVVTEKTGSTSLSTIGQICDKRQLPFSGSGRFASRPDAACDTSTDGFKHAAPVGIGIMGVARHDALTHVRPKYFDK